MEEKIVLRPVYKKFQFIRASDIAWKKRKHIQRAGIIFYFIEGGKMHFILGLDSSYREWTDFGGCVKAGETGKETAYRECKEETLGIFDDLFSLESIDASHAVIEKSLVVLFTPIKIKREDFTERQKLFQRKKEEIKITENEDIGLFTMPDLEALIQNEKVQGYKMYERVSSLLIKKHSDIKHWSVPSLYSPK